MALIDSFERSGNWLFRYRGQVPLLLFLLAIPVIYFTDYTQQNVTIFYVVNWLSVVVAVLGFLVRAYTIGTTPRGTSGRNTEKQVAEQLNTNGIYSIVRHPLYLGNFLMWIGIVLFTQNFYFVIVVSLAYWLYYERIMFAEERFLERKFGDVYLKWSRTVPAFVPAFSGWKKSAISFSIKSVLRREYSGFLATVVGFIFVRMLIQYKRTGSYVIEDFILAVLITSVVITLLLRTLKHSTNLLSEEGRS